MAFSVINYVLSKNIVEETADGLGAVKGSPCTISSTKDVDEGVLVTFKWTGISGETETRTILVPKGKDGETPTISISNDGYWVINNNKLTIIYKLKKD